jgi:EmrB/QacA subfamily drug resistance transporter
LALTGTASAPAPRATPEALSRRRIRLVMGGLLLGLLIAALDQTIVATALPTIAGDLHGLSHLSWVVTAYLLSSTASTPLWGKLGDLYGRKTIFQIAIVIFVIGSALAGLSKSMAELIAFRALQGVGGGGLIVGAQAIIGDVVSPRERGRYQGVFGAVFGVSSVVGPLIGGFFVQSLSWRWVFYVNLPIGAVALAVTALVLPGTVSRIHHAIDYLGTALLAALSTALVLITTLGGTTYRWSSSPIIVLIIASVVLLIGFAVTERRAAEPVLPLSLFRNRIFSTTSAVGFVVGFGMFGAITYLPQYMQVVRGVSPTSSGLRLLPLMAGLLVTSTTSGALISRWGRYKVFPVAGTAFMVVGLFLLSRLGVSTSTLDASIFMFVLGVGLGGVIQVLVIAVQNAVEYRELGVATSGATYFRSIGGSFGTAVFGAVFSARLAANLPHYLAGVHIPSSFSATGGASPAALAALPPPVHHGYVSAYAASLQTVFLVAVPIAALAFGLSWLIKEVPLRRTVSAANPADSLAPSAIPAARTSIEELARALSVLSNAENTRQIYLALAERAGLDLGPPETWTLLRIGEHVGSSPEQLADHVRVPLDRLREIIGTLRRAGFVDVRVGAPGPEQLMLTRAGLDALERLAEARRTGLAALLSDWTPEQHEEIALLVARLAADLLADRSTRHLLIPRS